MRPRIFRHFGLKILSVVLATLIWMLVAGQREAERSLRVPLEYRNIPEQLEMLGDPTSLVDVRLRGTSGALAQLRGTDLVAVIDLKGARSGRRLFHILSTDVAAPTGVKVLQISPATLSLTFETSAVKTVPVVPDIDDQPAAGYEIVKVTATPSTVDISGPTSEVEGVTEATTEPVSVAGATTSLIDTVTAGVADANVRLRLSRSIVVTVEIRPLPVERTMSGAPVTLRNVRPGLHGTVRPGTITLRVKGSASTLDALQPAELALYVDLNGLGPGRYNLPVLFEKNADITVLHVEPAKLDVRVR